MPYQSKSQQRLFFLLQGRGELKPGTAEAWAKKTDFKKLPEKVKSAASLPTGPVQPTAASNITMPRSRPLQPNPQAQPAPAQPTVPQMQPAPAAVQPPDSILPHVHDASGPAAKWLQAVESHFQRPKAAPALPAGQPLGGKVAMFRLIKRAGPGQPEAPPAVNQQQPAASPPINPRSPLAIMQNRIAQQMQQRQQAQQQIQQYRAQQQAQFAQQNPYQQPQMQPQIQPQTQPQGNPDQARFDAWYNQVNQFESQVRQQAGLPPDVPILVHLNNDPTFQARLQGNQGQAEQQRATQELQQAQWLAQHPTAVQQWQSQQQTQQPQFQGVVQPAPAPAAQPAPVAAPAEQPPEMQEPQPAAAPQSSWLSQVMAGPVAAATQAGNWLGQSGTATPAAQPAQPAAAAATPPSGPGVATQAGNWFGQVTSAVQNAGRAAQQAASTPTGQAPSAASATPATQTTSGAPTPQAAASPATATPTSPTAAPTPAASPAAVAPTVAEAAGAAQQNQQQTASPAKPAVTQPYRTQVRSDQLYIRPPTPAQQQRALMQPRPSKR